MPAPLVRGTDRQELASKSISKLIATAENSMEDKKIYKGYVSFFKNFSHLLLKGGQIFSIRYFGECYSVKLGNMIPSYDANNLLEIDTLVELPSIELLHNMPIPFFIGITQIGTITFI